MQIFGLINEECALNDFLQKKNNCEKIPSFGANFIFEMYEEGNEY